MNIRNWLTSIYPLAWRERYGDEFEMLLEECLHSPLDVLDILLGALDAHLDSPHAMNWRTLNMINKLRTSILLVFAGYIGFVLGGLSLYGLADDSPMAALMRSGAPRMASVRSGSPLSAIAAASATSTMMLVTASSATKSPSMTIAPAAIFASGCTRESGAAGSGMSGASILMSASPS